MEEKMKIFIILITSCISERKMNREKASNEKNEIKQRRLLIPFGVTRRSEMQNSVWRN